MTTRDDKLKKLQDVTDQVAYQVYEDIAYQSKIVAANLITGVGDKGLFTATGFVFAVESIHEAALAWFLSESYVELTDKAKAPEDEVAKRRAERAARNADAPEEPADKRAGGQYL